MTSLTHFYSTSILGGCQMKNTGMIRPLDNLGRIVLPKEIRKTFGVDTGDSFTIHTDGDSIILKKFQASCVLCGNNEDLVTFNDKAICPKCIGALGGKPHA